MLAALTLLLVQAEAAGQVTTLRNLTFGIIPSGTTTTVLKTSANSAQWRITGTFLLGGTFALTLPTTLTGPGTAIPIAFSTTAGQRNTANNPNGGTSFNPHTSQPVTLVTLGTIFLWLGASVSPPPNQAPGNYGATVVLTTTGML